MTLAVLEAVRAGEEAAYPGVRKLKVAHGHVELGDRVSASASQEQTGFAFVSEDQRQVFQTRFDGFTFSRLAPYGTWEPFRDEARRLWTLYRERVNPVEVTRLAVRYINRFDLPGTEVEMKEYFRTTPEISPDLPQVLSEFFMQVLFAQEDLRGHVLISQTIIPPATPDVMSVVLDIDLFRMADVPNDENAIWRFFEQLRERKDEIFEACITERARELIGQCQQ